MQNGGTLVGIREKLTQLGELPWSRSVVTINDGSDLYAENCLAIAGCVCGEQCDEIVLRIRCSGCDRLLRVKGTGLLLESSSAYGAHISGAIAAIEYIDL